MVLSVEPKVGATDVDPDLREIRVTFSKPMIDQSWSWVSGNVYATPKADGKIHYEKDRRTCVMPVKLEPGKTYVLGINSERFHNFKDVDGRPASPYLVAFRTRAKRERETLGWPTIRGRAAEPDRVGSDRRATADRSDPIRSGRSADRAASYSGPGRVFL